MSEKTLKARLVNKHDIEVNWLKSSFIPMKGELVVFDIEVDADGNTLELPEGRTAPYLYERFKIGDGEHNVNDLPFATDGYVSYDTEQTLTDEQRAQARANISKYKWSYVTDFLNTTWGVSHVSGVNDWDALLEYTSESTGFKSLAAIVLYACMCLTSKSSTRLKNMRNIATYCEELFTSGIVDNVFSIYLSNESEDVEYCISFNDISKTACNISITNYLGKGSGILQYNKETDSIVYDSLSLENVDKTLSIENRYADAKVVGDKFTEVQDSLDSLSSLVGDTPVASQISEAITNSVADWSQTDETAPDYIKNKPDEDDALELVAEMGLVSPLAASDGSIYTDENGVVYTL